MSQSVFKHGGNYTFLRASRFKLETEWQSLRPDVSALLILIAQILEVQDSTLEDEAVRSFETSGVNDVAAWYSGP
jgi:hypothetical protein